MNVLTPIQRWPNLYHPGPATAWLSAAPRSLDEYTGDGDWFKILSVVGRTEQSVQPDDEYYWKHQWGTYQAKSVSCFTYPFKYAYISTNLSNTQWRFTIPTTTPPGNYLLRFEHIYPLPLDSLYVTSSKQPHSLPKKFHSTSKFSVY